MYVTELDCLGWGALERVSVCVCVRVYLWNAEPLAEQWLAMCS